MRIAFLACLMLLWRNVDSFSNIRVSLTAHHRGNCRLNGKEGTRFKFPNKELSRLGSRPACPHHLLAEASVTPNIHFIASHSTTAYAPLSSSTLLGECAHVVSHLRSTLRAHHNLDVLLLLSIPSLVSSVFKAINISSTAGLILAGAILGPTGLNVFNSVHGMEWIGELGIMFFLFESGSELTTEKWREIKKDVFGLGLRCLVSTASLLALILRLANPLSPVLSWPAAAVIGSSLAISSSALVVQLFRELDIHGPKFAHAAHNVLLVQDVALFPVLLLAEVLASSCVAHSSSHGRGGGGVATAIRACCTASLLSVVCRFAVSPFLSAMTTTTTTDTNTSPKHHHDHDHHHDHGQHPDPSLSQDRGLTSAAFAVLSMASLARGLGLPDTLGAFLAGLSVAGTPAALSLQPHVSVLRSLFLNVFFLTVGFSVDLQTLRRSPGLVLGLASGLFAVKSSVTALVVYVCGLSTGDAWRCGLLTGHVGEFALLSLGIAMRAGWISHQFKQLFTTSIALTMLFTPLLSRMWLGEGGGHKSYEIHEKKNI